MRRKFPQMLSRTHLDAVLPIHPLHSTLTIAMPTATSTTKRSNDQPHFRSKKSRRAVPSTSASTSTLSLPHPLAVKPAGNAFFASTPSNRSLTLGSIAILSDELIMHILTSYHLSAPEIATLSCVSRGMRAFANSEAIWRNLFVESTHINSTLTSWRGSWKQTVAAHCSPSHDHIPHLAPFSNPHGQPFYSDVLYLSHRLSLLPLDRFIKQTHGLRDVDGRGIWIALSQYDPTKTPVTTAAEVAEFCKQKWIAEMVEKKLLRNIRKNH